MQTIEPIVRANVLSAFGVMLAKSSVDQGQLLASVGLTLADLEDPLRYISLNTVAELFELAATRTNDPSFGIHYAEVFPAGATGLLGQLMLSSATVGEAVKVAQQFVEVQALPMRLSLEEHDGIYSLQVGYPSNFTAPQMHYTGFLFAAACMRLRLGTGASWCPYAVEFAHRKPQILRDYEAYFGPRVSFDAAHNRIDIRAEDFDKPMPKLLNQLSVSLRDYAERVLVESRTRKSIVEFAAAVLYERLEKEQSFDMEALAAHLGMQVRALQWRLEQAGTSYERLLSRTRKRMAVRLLRDTDLAIAQIAARLGYSEASPFTRAAQKWFNATPTAHRQRLRQAGPGYSDEDMDE
jgi:AraC-like DNA-binding protein